MSTAKRLVVRTLGLPAISGLAQHLSSSHLRIVAYHGVKSRSAFERQLKHIVHRYHPVSGEQVGESLRGGAPLPSNAVWLTLDDRLASVVSTAPPLLDKYGVRATMFVCPGLATSGQAPWWEVIRLAIDAGWQLPHVDAPDVLRNLKLRGDAERRAVVEDAARFVSDRVPADPAATESALDAWQQAGFELGNHTWDHPCLDHCEPSEQIRQIQLADDWLTARGAFKSVRLFAYPNGDWTADAERAFIERGYEMALLFDHRTVAPDTTEPLRLSRLRLDASDPLPRAGAILSGSHSWLYRTGQPQLMASHS